MKSAVNTWQILWHNNKRKRYLLVSALVTIAIAVIQPLLIHQVYGKAQLIDLLESLQNSSLYFGSATATASATVLALMLTLLSMTNQLDHKFERSVYKRIQLVGLVSTITFIISLLLLLCLSLPIGEFQDIPVIWFKGLYYVISLLNGLLSGLMIVGVLILFETISLLISKLAPDES